jgi:long-chain acyl-CoA synthetase
MLDVTGKAPLDMLWHWEKTRPGKIYLRQPVNGVWHEYTFAQVADQVRRIAAAIKALNFPAGSHIAIAGRNCAHWFIADWAIAMAGHVSVGLYPKQATDAVSYILKHCEAKLIFIGPMQEPESILNGIPPEVKRVSMPYPDVAPGDYEWEDWLQQYRPLQGDIVPDPDKPWTLVYTSGTTGNPKGVEIKGAAVMFALQGMLKILKPGDDERIFSYLPLAHIFERGAVEMFSIYTGAQVSFLESLEKFAEQLAEVAPTRFIAVPAVWTRIQQGILKKLPQQKLDRLLKIPVISGLIKKKIKTGLGLQNSRLNITGAAAIPVSTLEWFNKLGIPIMQGYGMTENCAYVSVNLPDANKFGSVGRAVPGCEVKLSEEGEILTRSPAQMTGYYKEPEKTAETLAGGWVHTGDKGRIDEDGFIFITGRVKDIFKTLKGKYVAPAPIEGKLATNSNIEMLCLVGAGLKQPVALVVLSENAKQQPREVVTQSLTASLEQLNATLEAHEEVAGIVVVREPWSIDNGFLTPTMKIKRHSVEERYAGLVNQCLESKQLVIWED